MSRAAVTLGRGFTNTFAGIRLVDVPLFIAMQLLGGGAAVVVAGWLTNSGVHSDPVPSPLAKESP